MSNPVTTNSTFEASIPHPGVMLVRIVSQPLGAFTVQARRELKAFLERAHIDHSARCIVLTGTGPAFSVGSNIREFEATPDWIEAARLAETDLNETIERGPLPVIAILPGVDRVDFQLQLESDDFPVYQVALKNPATTRIIWRSGRLRAAPGDAIKVVSVSLPARLLKPQNYDIELTGIPAGGFPQFMGSYAFTSTR